jgi:hypothetical protein
LGSSGLEEWRAVVVVGCFDMMVLRVWSDWGMWKEWDGPMMMHWSMQCKTIRSLENAMIYLQCIDGYV